MDTEPLWNAVQRRLVIEHGGTWSDDLAASLVGRPLDEGARRLQEAGLDLPVQRIIDLTMDEVVQGVVNGVPWRPGARELLVALAEADISARRGIMSTHRQPPYRDLAASGSLPITEHLTDNTLILPVYHTLSNADQDRVIAVLRDPLKEAIG